MSTSDDESLAADADAGEEDVSPRRMSRKAKIWGWAGVAALVAVASWFGWESAQQPVRWNDVGFAIESPTSAEATYDVYLYKDKDAVCNLRSLSSKFAEVGVADTVVKLANGRQQRITAAIVTTEEATTAVVKYCEPVD
jgi:hypothetical protein